MPNRTDLEARHAKAGDRYAKALDELLSAMIDLSAIEGALPAGPDGQGHLRTFACDVPDALPMLRHRQFAPTLPKSIRALVQAQRSQMETSL